MEADYYRYQPLKLHSREIRLVTLLPGFWDDDICCTTHVSSLDQAPNYSALSYVWGDRATTEPIFLDGQRFQVTKNLGSALRHLRQKMQVLILWVDSLCIDQDNDVEKSWQVNMMGDIYKACQQGLLWLGAETEDSDRWCTTEEYGACKEGARRRRRRELYGSPPHEPQGQSYQMCKWHGRRPRMSEAFALIDLVAADVHLHEIPSFYNLISSSSNADHPRFVEPVQALGALMRRSWWTRIWTVQEAVLPPTADLICGSLRLSWTTVTEAAENLGRHSRTCCASAETKLDNALEYSTYGAQTWLSVDFFRTEVGDLETLRSGILQSQHWGFQKMSCSSISRREASDPRDKVYGLLGLVSQQNRRLVAVDYNIDIISLNERLSRDLLLRGDLRTLDSRHSRHVGTDSGSPIPSWTKDFSRTPSRVYQAVERWRYKIWGGYAASGDKNASVSLRNENTISFAGVRVDEVAATSHVLEELKGDTYEIAIRRLLAQCANLIDLAVRSNERYPRGGVGVEEAFLRTSFGNQIREGNRSRKPGKSILSELKQLVFGPGGVAARLQLSNVSNVWVTIAERRFFITEEGLMGFGPADMRVGDEVWVLFGSTVPYVLRPLDTMAHNHASSGPGTRRSGNFARRHRASLGGCYVHGIMEGEAVADGEEWTVVLR